MKYLFGIKERRLVFFFHFVRWSCISFDDETERKMIGGPCVNVCADCVATENQT